MSAPKLPALRLTAEGDCIIQEGISLDFPPSRKFSVSYAPSHSRQNSLSGSASNHESISNGAFDSEPHTSDGDSGDDMDVPPLNSDLKVAPPPPSDRSNSHTKAIPEKPIPHFSRALSMPLPSQLSQLQHPHRPGPPNYFTSSPAVPSTQSSQVREVSMELADLIQLAIQTMLQISPPQVLDPAKELFSACALSVPTSSMSALFTAMKNINYVSANMSSFCDLATSLPECGGPANEQPPETLYNEFDIGEVLQCVGDALSGAAAQSGVDLVIYHGDVGLKHVYVSGDESGISFALSHIIRQVLSTAERGDSIELGLLVSPISTARPGLSTDVQSAVDDLLSPTPLECKGPIRITIRISHKYAPSETHQGVDLPEDVVTTETRPKPSFSTLLLRRILRQINGNLVSDLPPPEAFTSGRTCDFEMVLDRVSVPVSVQNPEEASEVGLNTTLEQLSAFGETLKGKRVTLYASAKGSFAHHLTSYLTAWGMDVTHVSPDGQVDGVGDQLSSLQDEARMSSYNQLLATYPLGIPPGLQLKPDQRPTPPESPSFIVIDDDIDILKERLQALRFDNQPQVLTQNGRKRPSLSTNHRPRSSPQMARLLGLNNLAQPPTPVVIMHFSSLSNYKSVKDVMQSVMVSYTATSTPLPEVMIIPKPAGPRRILTALHISVTKPVIDPLFMPIATSPMSPGVQHAAGSFFAASVSEQSVDSGSSGSHGPASQPQSPASKNGHRPHGSRTNSDRSTKSSDSSINLSALPPSPLALPDNIEYFSAAAQKLGTSPSSGLVIQSPDGQTAGIYFHPRSRSGSKNPSTPSMERDRGQLTVPGPRGSTPRVPSGGNKREMEDGVSFGSLHEASPSRRPSLNPKPESPSPERVLSVGPMEDLDQLEQPSLASSILSPVPRRKSDDTRRLASPSGTSADGTNTPTRRSAAKRNEVKDSASPPSSSKRGGKGTASDANVMPPISVLIVDDNPINQTILSTFMRRKKIKYDLASNGQEAVQKWHTGGFHLILMDIQMPVMDGIQATKEIRRLEKINAAAGYPPLSPSTEGGQTSSASSTTSESKSINSPFRSSVIIVALTASSLQSDRVAALAAGCNDFLTKPVSLLWLNNKIIEWGSIKALQMWADIRPDAVRTMQSGQVAQARNVAERLHVPAKARLTPPPQTRRSTSVLEDNAAALALASSARIPPFTPSYFKVPDQPPTTSSPLADGIHPALHLNVLDTSDMADLLDSQPLKRKSVEAVDDGAAT
ncbi:hypothetical protein BDZ97DRAFT_684522 [Flammula alnicola]|nr:hypothetical protein BDZ97DRAFT_684522 [Flammula alnicola]